MTAFEVADSVICSAGKHWHRFLRVGAAPECKCWSKPIAMQALPNCSIAEEAQEAKGAEEKQSQATPAKGLAGVFGGTQSIKAQPRQPKVVPSLRLAVACLLADRKLPA